ncbi:LLM class flavin-dependent oxidoreductase [Cohnella caldifontis]|uniref:LLM class flavin-dependent oxidoreductase n=1 Tax=Cohnella caldifontis TaxID=3027471 RepID=UPI0023ED5ACE|nr:LLM class flavin-dependent oxidoreductase [Cohnella sp. YIM B05605]
MKGRGKPLKLGVLDLLPVPDGKDDAYALSMGAELARLAERLGYSRYWVAEHHDMPHLACPAPEVFLAHVGAVTNRIRIGSGAVLLPHYAPLKVAESFRLLASLYPGRVDLGIGRAPGGNAHASMALSGNFLENVARMPDKLRDLTRLLQGNYAYEGQPVAARPDPAEPPEIWLLGTHRKSAGYAAEYGMGYVFGQFMSDTDAASALAAYRDSFVPSPLCPEPKAVVAIGIVCAETDEEARGLVRASGESFGQEAAGGESPDERMERKLLAGSPRTVRDRLLQLSEEFGVDEFLVVTMISDYPTRMRSYELLAQCLYA